MCMKLHIILFLLCIQGRKKTKWLVFFLLNSYTDLWHPLNLAENYLLGISFIHGWSLEHKMWFTGEGKGKKLQYACLENPMNSMKKQKDKTLKDELPRLVGAQNATGDQWRNNSWKNEEMEPKQKQHPVVDVTGDWSKVWCCKEQYCIGTWNVRSMNQSKLEVVKQEMARVNIFSCIKK